ncbi:MAG: HEAT repeat domain-containing protein [Acidimicrobiia bacterium]
MTTPGPVARAAAIAGLGHRHALEPGELSEVVAAAADADPRVRSAALGTLVRGSSPDAALVPWRAAMQDLDAAVRRRAAELGAVLGTPACVGPLVEALGDRDVTVVEAAAWSLGELGAATVEDAHAVASLARVTTDHQDAIAREAAVAALGALGDVRGLPAVLRATGDKPAVRRRAVLALAPFEGDDVDAALQRALEDRDWQVRQAAEDLTGP